jgi:hypothetical protein
VNNRHQVVGAQVLLNELPRGDCHPLRAREVRVEIVDHHDVDTAVEGTLVRLHVRLDRFARIQRALVALDRHVDDRKGRDRLRFAVFEDLEISLLQIADEVPVAIDHDGIDLDVIDPDLERRRLQIGGRRILAGDHHAPGDQHEQRGESDASHHFFSLPIRAVSETACSVCTA